MKSQSFPPPSILLSKVPKARNGYVMQLVLWILTALQHSRYYYCKWGNWSSEFTQLISGWMRSWAWWCVLSPSYLGGWGGRITWAQTGKQSKTLYLKKQQQKSSHSSLSSHSLFFSCSGEGQNLPLPEDCLRSVVSLDKLAWVKCLTRMKLVESVAGDQHSLWSVEWIVSQLFYSRQGLSDCWPLTPTPDLFCGRKDRK
jgi:hypothetical protein